MERSILHCDMNSFFASVELLSLPEMKEKPVAVCGDPESRRGIILAKNEHAKKYGIVTAETIWQAKKKCPQLILVPAHHDRYKEYYTKINEIYLRYTDMVEPFSIDESWLDVTASLHLFGTGKRIADQIRETVKEELGLTLSAGVSFNKIFAKMGSDYKKPDATTVISRQNYKELLWPLAVRELFFVGKVTAEKLSHMGIQTIGDLANSQESLLTSVFGKHGQQLYAYANGKDDSPVTLYTEKEEMKSIGNSITFRRNLVGEKDIGVAVIALSDKVGVRLRRQKLKCGSIKVDIKDPLFKTISRQRQLKGSTNLSEEIYKVSMDIIKKSWHMKDPIRLISITGIGLVNENQEEQLSLFEEENKGKEKTEKMERTMDSIREKYGKTAITYGGVMGNDIGIDTSKEEKTE